MQAIQAEYWQRINEIWKKHDCNPAKSLVSLGLQAPTFLCFFAGLRHLAAAKVRPCPRDITVQVRLAQSMWQVGAQDDQSMCRCHP